VAKKLDEDFLGLAAMADKAASLAGSPFTRRHWETVAQEYRVFAAQAAAGTGSDLAPVCNERDFNCACDETGLDEDALPDRGTGKAATTRLREVLATAFRSRGKRGR
jgi:hypothetical protein